MKIKIFLTLILIFSMLGCQKKESITKEQNIKIKNNQRKKLQDAAVSKNKLIVIDAGHQQKGNSNLEPIAPHSKKKKAKVANGTFGKWSQLKEYELTLQIALKLEKELKLRGYKVLMIRTTNDIDISNSERAKIANQSKADAFIRLHANGSTNSQITGAMTICQTPSNPNNEQYYKQSRYLSKTILNNYVKETGAKKERIWETDTMSGINWCQVPVTILEMGYMTNKEEDLNMASEEYQKRMVRGIANGIDKYFEKEEFYEKK